MRKTIVLINPFVSPGYLSEELKKYNRNTTAFFTKKPENLNHYFKVSQDLFDEQIYLDDPTITEIIDILKKINNIEYIISGSEFSTPLAEKIIQQILPELSNDPNTSSLRVNKFDMQEILKMNGLPYIKQVQVDINQIDENLIKDGLTFPCFCKPLNGLGTIGAFKANSLAEITDKIYNFISTKKIINIDHYLVQEYIRGEEYFVDTFSFKGKHYISSVQKYQKELINGKPTLRHSELEYDQNIWNKCAEFAKQVLTATDFNNGFAHIELFITADNGLKLIEINPRISGGRGCCNKLAESLDLKSQIDILISSLEGSPEESHLNNRKGFSRRLYLFNWASSPLKDPSNILKNLPSLSYFDLLKPVGFINENLDKDVTDIDLFALLHSNDFSLIEKDTLYLFELEKLGNLL